MRAVNLLPPDPTKRTKTNIPALVGVAGTVLSIGVLAMLFMSANSKVHDRRDQLDAIEAQIAVIPPPPPPDTAGEGLAAQQQARLGVLATALSRRVAWDRVLREVSLVLPGDVWLTQLAASSPVVGTSSAPPVPPLPTAVPNGLAISGYTYSQPSVARLLSRLELVPDLSDVQLQSSTRAQIGTQSVVQFSIAANIRTGVTS